MSIITLQVSAAIQGTRASFQWLRHFKNIFCSRLHYGNKTFEMTAVEFLIQQIVDRQNGIANGSSLDEIFHQANELFEQQIIDAYDKGYDDAANYKIL
jgi:hypothetical protein